jgi:2-methylcitrate dehydratase PrpD
VARDDIVALRGRVHAVAESSIDEAAADIAVTMNDGRRHHIFIEHAIGSLQRPMTDDHLAGKFHGLVDPVLGSEQADELIAHCRRIASVENVRTLAELARPR